MKKLFSFVACLFLASCLTLGDGPENKIHVKNISQVEGRYKNRSEDGYASLSGVIWPDLKDSAAVHSVKVSIISNDQIMLEGKDVYHNTIMQKIAKSGVDFSISEGGFNILHSRIDVGADTAVGIGYMTFSFELDKSGSVYLNRKSSVAALVAYMIPVAASAREYFKFARID